MRVSCVIPARNEQRTVAAVVAAALQCPQIGEVVVVDNGSSDSTAQEARSAGAKVVYQREVGLGNAMTAGAQAAASDWILKTDADISNASPRWFSQLIARQAETQADLVRAVFETEGESFPLTTLVVIPLLQVLRPHWLPLRRPLSGTYLAQRQVLLRPKVPTGWAFDFSVYAHLRTQGARIEEVDIGTLNDEVRPLAVYQPVARELIEYMLQHVADSRPGSTSSAVLDR